MAGPFVRRRGASIDLHEGEKCLKREGLYEDMVELYHHKKEHEKGNVFNLAKTIVFFI